MGRFAFSEVNFLGLPKITFDARGTYPAKIAPGIPRADRKQCNTIL